MPTLSDRIGGLWRATADVSGLYAANVVNGVLGVAFVPVALRALGAAGYGVFSIYGVLAGYLVLTELGLGKNLFRVLAACRTVDEEQRQLRLAFGLYLGLASTVLVLAPLLAFVVTPVVFPMSASDQTSVGRIAILTSVEYVAGVPVYLMQTRCLARERFPAYARFTLLSGLGRYGLSFLAVFLFRQPEAVVAVIASRRLIDCGLARLIMGALPQGSWTPRFVAREANEILGRSSVLSLAQFMQLTLVASGSVLVNFFFGVTALGIYRVAFDLASKIWFFSHPVSLVIFPRFVRWWTSEDGRPRLARLLPRMLELSGFGYLLIGLGAAWVGPVLLPLVGLGGRDLGLLFVLLALAICLNAHASLANEFVLATGQYRLTVILGIVGCSSLVTTFLMLRSVAPALAIGWAWLASQILYALAADTVALKMLGLDRRLVLFEILGRALVVGAGALALAWLVESRVEVLTLVVAGTLLAAVLARRIHRLWGLVVEGAA